MSKEYIFELGDALYNEETGESCFNPVVKGELIRCKDCKHNDGSCCDYSAVYTRPNGYCQWGERKEKEDSEI